MKAKVAWTLAALAILVSQVQVSTAAGPPHFDLATNLQLALESVAQHVGSSFGIAHMTAAASAGLRRRLHADGPLCSWDDTVNMCTGEVHAAKELVARSPRKSFVDIMECALEEDQDRCESNEACAWRAPPVLSHIPGMGEISDSVPTSELLGELQEQAKGNRKDAESVCMPKKWTIPRELVNCIGRETLLGKMVHCLAHLSEDVCRKDAMCSWGIDNSLFFGGPGGDLFDAMHTDEAKTQEGDFPLPVDTLVGQLPEMCIMNVGENPAALFLEASADPMVGLIMTCGAADIGKCNAMSSDCKWNDMASRCLPAPESMITVTFDALQRGAVGGDLCAEVVDPWLHCARNLDEAGCNAAEPWGIGHRCGWQSPKEAVAILLEDEIDEMELEDGEAQDKLSTKLCQPNNAVFAVAKYMFPHSADDQKALGGLLACPQYGSRDACAAGSPMAMDSDAYEQTFATYTKQLEEKITAHKRQNARERKHVEVAVITVVCVVGVFAPLVALALLAHFRGQGPLVGPVDWVKERFAARYFRANESLMPDREVDFYSF